MTMKLHLVPVDTQEGFFLYDRSKTSTKTDPLNRQDQPVQVFDWERVRWVDATDPGERVYQPKFRVPFCPERLSVESVIRYTLEAQDKIPARDGNLLVLLESNQDGTRLGFATSPALFVNQPGPACSQG